MTSAELHHERAVAALHGLAVGDALGMPTQTFTRAQVRLRWPVLTGFEVAPPDQPVCPGRAAGSVTDDTEQALLVGRLLVAHGGRLDPRVLADALLAWERDVASRGSLDLLGPSTRRAVAAIAAGADPRTTGRDGDTDGSAMRIPPVGIAVPAEPLRRLVDAVVDAGRPTHDTAPAHAGAAAVAAAVSAGVEGGAFEAALQLAVAAAREGARHGTPRPGVDVAERITDAVRLVRTAASPAAALDLVETRVGTGLLAAEAVPAAFALAALHPDDAWAAGLDAATLGGDTDTVAAMACAVLGATGARLPRSAVATVVAVNGLDVAPLAARLLALRQAAAA